MISLHPSHWVKYQENLSHEGCLAFIPWYVKYLAQKMARTPWNDEGFGCRPAKPYCEVKDPPWPRYCVSGSRIWNGPIREHLVMWPPTSAILSNVQLYLESSTLVNILAIFTTPILLFQCIHCGIIIWCRVSWWPGWPPAQYLQQSTHNRRDTITVVSLHHHTSTKVRDTNQSWQLSWNQPHLYHLQTLLLNDSE